MAKHLSRKRPLGQLSVEQFMAFCSSEEEGLGNDEDGDGGGSEDDIGVVEPRPFDVTSWKRARRDSSEDESEEEGRGGEEGEEEEEESEGEREAEERLGKNVTLQMVKAWVKSLEKKSSLHTLRLLCGALHAAMATLLRGEQEKATRAKFVAGRSRFVVKDSAVFNAIVVACFQHVPSSLSHHFPESSGAGSKARLPSSQEAWGRVKRTVKQYLFDIVRLAETLQDVDMQSAVLKHVHSMAIFFVCFPKLLKVLNKCLIEKWSTADSHVQVLAFLAMRRLVLFQSHPALHVLLKKVYMAFVRNCKFSTSATLSGIKFMTSSLVELLAVDPPTSYQHGFVYIRQLAGHLRTALTAGKKDAQQVVYNWQYVHCLNMWSEVLCRVSHSSLRPLIYPLVQITLGTLQVQPSAKYHPLRLHLVKMLLQLSRSTNTYIPVASYLLEVIETHGVDVGNGKLQSGKPSDLSMLLRASKLQLGTRSFRTLLLNEAYQLLLQYFSDHAHYIGFPELAYPSLVRLRKVNKSTPYSWLRTQLKQLIEKVEEVCKEVTMERASVTYSPGNFDLITSWENQHKEKENGISRFLATWTKFHHVQAQSSIGHKQESVAAKMEDEGEEGDDEEASDEDLVINWESESESG